MDMRTGFSMAGSVELGVMAAAGAQMARFYSVPVSLHGPWTDSMTHDDQSTMERMYMTLMAAMAGANVLVGAGMMQQSLVTSHEQLVIDSEINRIAFQAVEGFEIDLDRLAVDAIDRVGPGGNFVADMHTLRFLRGERFVPKLQYRASREAWEAAGAKTMLQRAKDQALTILAEHEPNPLPEYEAKELDKLVAHALKTITD
jgi:trimethylamine--corrinoid protein Co-methyltransferase